VLLGWKEKEDRIHAIEDSMSQKICIRRNKTATEEERRNRELLKGEKHVNDRTKTTSINVNRNTF
jgi:hypothetical protein